MLLSSVVALSVPARWIVQRDPALDVSQYSLKRFAPEHNTEEFLRGGIPNMPSGHFSVES